MCFVSHPLATSRELRGRWSITYYISQTLSRHQSVQCERDLSASKKGEAGKSRSVAAGR